MKQVEDFVFDKIILLLFSVGVIALMGCEKNYYVEYIVENDSDRILFIEYIKSGEVEVDSNFLNSGYKLIFFIDTGKDLSMTDYMNELDELPLTHIKLEDEEGNRLFCSEQDINCWKKRTYKDRNGIIYLRVKESSFKE